MLKKLLRKIFWSKYLKWFRTLLQVPTLPLKFPPIEDLLAATGGPAKPPRGYYTTFSGVDIKAWFESSDQQYACLAELWTIDWNVSKDGVTGTLRTALFDRDAIANLPFVPVNLILVACNEYGLASYTKFKDIKFLSTFCHMSIDDLIFELSTNFTASSYTPWTAVGTNNDELITMEKRDQILEVDSIIKYLKFLS